MIRLVACAAALALAAPASAQTLSAPPAAAAPVAAEPAAPAPAAKPRPRRAAGPRAAAALTVVNARATPAVQVAVMAGDKTVRTSRPLAPNARATLKLPRMQGCTVMVAATYDADEALTEVGAVDACKEKSVRLVD